MLVLEAWIVTFGESLVGNVGFASLCPARVSSRVSWKSVQQECLAKSAQQECQARVSSKMSSKECQERVSSKSV